MASIHYQTQSYDPISCYGNSVERTNQIAHRTLICLVLRLSLIMDRGFYFRTSHFKSNQIKSVQQMSGDANPGNLLHSSSSHSVPATHMSLFSPQHFPPAGITVTHIHAPLDTDTVTHTNSHPSSLSHKSLTHCVTVTHTNHSPFVTVTHTNY